MTADPEEDSIGSPSRGDESEIAAPGNAISTSQDTNGSSPISAPAAPAIVACALNAPADSSSRERALARCQRLIKWYTKEKRRQRLAYQTFQVAAILLSGLTPILILWSDDPAGWTALPAALAAIAIGLLGIFQWKENYVRFAYVSEALQSEKNKFVTRTTTDYDKSLSEYEALSNFVTRVESLVMSEVSDWRGQMRKAVEKGSNST
jgi:hypothetical protein